MKNFIKWFGIIAFVAIIGFTFAACDDGDGGSGSGGGGSNPGNGTNPGSGTNPGNGGGGGSGTWTAVATSPFGDSTSKQSPMEAENLSLWQVNKWRIRLTA